MPESNVFTQRIDNKIHMYLLEQLVFLFAQNDRKMFYDDHVYACNGVITSRMFANAWSECVNISI